MVHISLSLSLSHARACTHARARATSEHLNHHGCVTAYNVNHLPARCFLRKPLGPYNQTLVAHYSAVLRGYGLPCLPSQSCTWVPEEASGWQVVCTRCRCESSLTAWLHFTLTSAMLGYKNLSDEVGQICKCRWWPCGSLVCTICCVYIEVRIQFWASKCSLPCF
jgi:hypothetical protein